METSGAGSKSTTRAARLLPVSFWTVVRRVPAPTWALVRTMPGQTGKPLPKTMPPQPKPCTFNVSDAAARMPAVFTEAGSGRAEGVGSKPENADGKLTPAMMPATRARKPGGRGAIPSRDRRMLDRWMAADKAGLGTRARLSPKNQETEITASAEKIAPTTLSIRPLRG